MKDVACFIVKLKKMSITVIIAILMRKIDRKLFCSNEGNFIFLLGENFSFSLSFERLMVIVSVNSKRFVNSKKNFPIGVICFFLQENDLDFSIFSLESELYQNTVQFRVFFDSLAIFRLHPILKSLRKVPLTSFLDDHS